MNFQDIQNYNVLRDIVTEYNPTMIEAFDQMFYAFRKPPDMDILTANKEFLKRMLSQTPRKISINDFEKVGKISYDVLKMDLDDPVPPPPMFSEMSQGQQHQQSLSTLIEEAVAERQFVPPPMKKVVHFEQTLKDKLLMILKLVDEVLGEI